MAGAAKRNANQSRGPNPSSGSSSSSGKASHSAPPSNASSSSRHSPRGYDGNRDPEMAERNPATSRPQVENKNLDLGVGGWSTIRGYDVPTTLPPRPKMSTLGQATKMGLNTFHVEAYPTKNVYQFDVLIGNGAEKRGLIMNVWESQAVQKALGKGFIFDGNKLAWNMNPIEREIRITVDLDAERGRTVKPGGKENKHRVAIRQTNRVGFAVLMSYLEGKASFDNTVLEAINFFDHLMREHPSTRLTKIKRSFFQKGETRFDLGSAVEAFGGAYQSIRIVHGAPKARLSVNVDVANGMFWKQMKLENSARELTGTRDIPDLISACRQGERGRAGQALKKYRKTRVIARHRKDANGKAQEDEFVIERFIYQSAKEYKFEKDGKQVSIYDHFAREYNIRLSWPDLPLVKMTTKGDTVLPMELLMIKGNARYPYKLDERQTANMIKFAVTAPKERWEAVQHGLRILDWAHDPNLTAYGVKINPAKTVVDARLLPAPVVKFGTGDAKPGTSGRWDLKGKKFLEPNKAPLKSWAVCVVPGRRGGKPDKTVVENFIREFVKIYGLHGGKVENKQPAFVLASSDDVGAWVTQAWNAAGNQVQARPQILVFILPDKDTITYGRIKRSGECRYGVVTQCMQYAHVQKCQGQYISNVCMKFNAKLGGTTCRAMGPKSGGATGLFTVPTVIFGADVSHAPPGAQGASMAALTMSTDRLACRYAATCETNGFRVEMITTDNVNSMMKPMLQWWVSNVGGGKFPSRIFYFRDGVSEGQYQHVLQQEVHDMKALIKSADPSLNIPFLVVIGSKRHHVRFFPDQGKGDRNGNAFPGTLVETGVTNPFENDFYLCAHAAIKGTARPMHYHVLLNEANISNDELQTLLYEHSYQYMRATTPVSQHPAIYYAHIASNRAGPHDPKWAGSTDGSGQQSSRTGSGSQGGGSQGRSGGSSGAPSDFEKLMDMPNTGGIKTSMWFI